MSAEQLDQELHDAWLDFDAVVEEPGVVIVRGMIEKPIPTQRTRIGRFPFELRVEGQLTAVEDDERIGGVPIESVTYTDGVLRFEGGIPGRVLITAPRGEGELAVANDPVEVRRWFRWRPVS